MRTSRWGWRHAAGSARPCTPAHARAHARARVYAGTVPVVRPEGPDALPARRAKPVALGRGHGGRRVVLKQAAADATRRRWCRSTTSTTAESMAHTVTNASAATILF